MAHDRIVNQHQPGVALYPRNLSYDLLPLIGPAGWSLLRALHDHADEQAILYRGARPIAPSGAEMEALAGVGEASLLVIKELLRVCGCLSWEDVRGKQEPRPGRKLKQAPTRSLVYYLHPLTGLIVSPRLVEAVFGYLERSQRAQAYLKANGILRPRPAYLPTSVWPALLPWMVETARWQELFQRVHGRGAHQAYRAEAHRWLESAAEVVATLEWEQQPLHEREESSVGERAAVVMARWHAALTVPSQRGQGTLGASHHGSPAVPPTPVNESTNQSGEGVAQVNKGAKKRGAQVAISETGAEQILPAEAALWREVPAVLGVADARVPYEPSRSERRLARRLLRGHSEAGILAALRSAVAAYQPQLGQPPRITRFGFAGGLPDFKAALAGSAGFPGSVATGAGVEDDFWHEYARVNERAPTRAERRRIESLAAGSSWSRLLTWLDRWESAHGASDKTIGPAYFEACAAAEPKHNDGGTEGTPGSGSRAAAASEPPPRPIAAGEVRPRLVDRLSELGIRKAEWLASLPTTTPELVEAWWHAASCRPNLKDKRGYAAVGIGSGRLPTPAGRQPAAEWTPAQSAPARTAELRPSAHGDLWRSALARLRAAVSPDEYATWLAPTEVLDIIGGIVVVGTPNVFVRDRIEGAYLAPMRDALAAELGRPVEVEVAIGSSVPV